MNSEKLYSIPRVTGLLLPYFFWDTSVHIAMSAMRDNIRSLLEDPTPMDPCLRGLLHQIFDNSSVQEGGSKVLEDQMLTHLSERLAVSTALLGRQEHQSVIVQATRVMHDSTVSHALSLMVTSPEVLAVVDTLKSRCFDRHSLWKLLLGRLIDVFATELAAEVLEQTGLVVVDITWTMFDYTHVTLSLCDVEVRHRQLLA